MTGSSAQQTSPVRIDTPYAWNAAALERSLRRLTISLELAQQMRNGAAGALANGLSADEMTRKHLPLAGARTLLEAIHHEVEQGPGVVLLQGLPTDSLDLRHNHALALAMADHIGTVVAQNFEGQRIVDVRDEQIPYSHRSRGYRSNALLPFHTDGANLFTLSCLSNAAKGGETILVSAAAVYNTLLEEMPTVLPVLMKGFHHHRRGQHTPGEPPLSPHPIPVFSFRQGILHCCYNRNPIDWVEKEGMPLTAAQKHALDAMDTILAREELQLKLNLIPGQMLVINNFCVLHSRTQYLDDDTHRRHLLRVWMDNPTSRWTGPSLLDLYVPDASRYARSAHD